MYNIEPIGHKQKYRPACAGCAAEGFMTYTTDEQYYIWLAGIEGVGPITFASLMERFGTPQAVFEQAPGHRDLLEQVPRVGAKLADRLARNATQEHLQSFLQTLEKKGIVAVSRLHALYPAELLQVFGPPLVLYCKGRTELLKSEKKIAVIGTRSPTAYGRDVAGKLGRALGGGGVTVVSGMARGIDICAHLGALEAHGDTIAVLGCGTDVVYPADKSAVYEQICREGLMLSEYIPGTGPLHGNFPARNRIISGLSRGVVVVEAAERSGTNITVSYALDQGRDVFAVPGNILTGSSASTNALIKSGCEVITNEQDVLEYYGWGGREPRKGAHKARNREPVQLSFQQRLVTDALQGGERSFDELFEVTEFSMPDLFTVLSELELLGVIAQRSGRIFALADGVLI